MLLPQYHNFSNKLVQFLPKDRVISNYAMVLMQAFIA